MRQLSLFKGKRQRGEKAPPPLEFHEHCTLADTLKLCISRGWEWTHIASGEYRTDATAARLKRMGVKPGWPDFIFIGAGEKLFFLELKRRGARLSEAQIGVHAHIIECGFPVRTAFGAKHAIEILKELGIIRATIEVR